MCRLSIEPSQSGGGYLIIFLTIFVMWCFVGVKFDDSLQKTIVSIRQEFEERKPFLQLLRGYASI